jgi:leucyl-tRNA synthetase
MEPIRKAALVKATIVEIGRAGSLDVTVSQIAKRAGMSSALAHHYFGSKEAMFLAAMRHVLTVYGAEVRGALAAADGPEARARAVIRASFASSSFRREVVAAGAACVIAVGASLGKQAKALRREIHSLLKQVDYDYQRLQYNTVVSGAMKMLNVLEKALDDFKAADEPGAAVALIEGFGVLLRALYPATPHITHALWSELGYATTLGELLDAPWPEVDPAALVQDEIELVLQVNGKLRGSVTVPASADKAAIEAAALASEAFQKAANGAPPKKVVVVPGRLVNVVL